MFSQEFREAYQAARIKHEDAHHSFPFDNCFMPECAAAWGFILSHTANTITDPKERLELLAVYQRKIEGLLQARTGLTVKVALSVHTSSNSTTDLHNLFKASLALSDFTQEKSSEHTWIAHKDLARHIAIHMPEGFDAEELYPEPEDDEGYRSAVEIVNARRFEGQLKHNDDEIPFQGA